MCVCSLKSTWRRHTLALLLLIAVGVAIYSNSLRGSFVFDDLPNIVNNPAVHAESLSPHVLLTAAFGSPLHGRPLANLSFALNYYWNGLDVTSYHVVNIVIHIANAMLVYAIALMLMRRTDQRSDHADLTLVLLALFAALVFVAHPVQTQSVTYIVQRMNSLAVLFYLAALLLYLKGRMRQDVVRRGACWAGALLAWLLALCCKENAATLPLLILLYEWYFHWIFNLGQLRRYALPLTAALLVFALVGLVYTGFQPWAQLQEGYLTRDFTLDQRLMTQPRVVVGYLGVLLLPLQSQLNLTPHVVTSTSLLQPLTTLPSLLLLTGLLGVAIWFARQWPLASFCVLWFFLHLAIESTIFPLEMAYQHRLYLPLVGVVILLAACVLRPAYDRSPSVTIAVAVVLISCLALGSYRRNQLFDNPLNVWSDVVQKSPGDYRAYYNRATWFAVLNEHQHAVDDYTACIRLREDHAVALANRAVSYQALEQPDFALQDFSQAIKLAPNNPSTHMNLANLLARQDRFDEAMAAYAEALRLEPEYAAAYFNRGIVRLRANQFIPAALDFTRAIEIDPTYVEAWYSRGLCAMQLRQTEGAVNDFSQAIQLRSDYLDAYIRRATVLGRMGQLFAARRDLGAAIKLSPRDPKLYNRRAVMYYSDQKYNEAWDDIRRCQELGGVPQKEFIRDLEAAAGRSGG